VDIFRKVEMMLTSPGIQRQSALEEDSGFGTGPEGGTMKKSKFSEEQIAYVLRQVDAGVRVAEVCRQVGVSEATFQIWKKK